jgi:hypothetical protein
MLDRAPNRRREAGEVADPLASIAGHCRECMGFQPGLVAGCTAPACWLYPWRTGKREKEPGKALA